MAKENIQLCYSKLLDTLRMLVFEETTEIEHFKVGQLVFLNELLIKLLNIDLCILVNLD